MVANELLHNVNIPRMVYEACEVVHAEMGTLASEAETKLHECTFDSN